MFLTSMEFLGEIEKIFGILFNHQPETTFRQGTGVPEVIPPGSI